MFIIKTMSTLLSLRILNTRIQRSLHRVPQAQSFMVRVVTRKWSVFCSPYFYHKHVKTNSNDMKSSLTLLSNMLLTLYPQRKKKQESLLDWLGEKTLVFTKLCCSCVLILHACSFCTVFCFQHCSISLLSAVQKDLMTP